MSLRLLNKSTPFFQTKREISGIARSRREQRSGNGPLYYMIVQRKPEHVFVLRKIYAVNVNFHLTTFLVLNLLSIQKQPIKKTSRSPQNLQ